jgi:hypothetical protein
MVNQVNRELVPDPNNGGYLVPTAMNVGPSVSASSGPIYENNAFSTYSNTMNVVE